MLRMAMPAWLATDASSRLSRAEYGSSDSRGPSTASPCSCAVARSANRHQAVHAEMFQLSSLQICRRQLNRLLASD